MRFILAVIGEQLVVSNRKKKDIMRDLQTQGFTAFHEKKTSDSSRDDGGSVDEHGQGQSQVDESSSEKGYDYLLSMKIWSLTMEKVEELIALRNAKRGELDVLISKSAEDLWLEDLTALELALDDFDSALEEATKQEDAARKKANHSRNNKDKGKAQKPRAKVMKGKAKGGSDDESDGDSDDDGVSSDSEFEETRHKKGKAVANRSKAAASAKTTSSRPQTSITKYLTTSSSTSSNKATAAPEKTAPSSTVQKSIIKYTNSKTAAAAAVQVVPPIVIPARNQETLRESMTLAERLKLKSSSAPSAIVDLSGSDDLFDSLSAFSSVPAAAPRDHDRVLQPQQTTKSGAKSKPKSAAVKTNVTPQKGAAGVKRSAKSSAVDGAAAVKEVFSPTDVSPVAAKRTKTTKPKAAAAPVSKAAAAVSKAPVQKSTGTTKTLQKNSKASKKAVADSDDEMDFSDSPPVKIVARSPKPVRARKQITYDVDKSEEEASDFNSDDDDDGGDESDFSDD
jgi:DNA topoisomerase-2